jgi:cytochrome c peroxidase
MHQSRRWIWIVSLASTLVLALVVGGCAPQPSSETEQAQPTAAEPSSSLESTDALGPMPEPEDNPTTPEKVALGHQLYYDTRLSADGSRSCYSCHVCEHGLTDGKPVAEGALGKVLTRSSPSLWNIGYHTEFYWDGRAPTMERQAMAAWTGANMSANAEEIVATLNGIEAYREQFQAVFGEDATADNVV